MKRHQILGWGIILGTLLVFSMIAAGVMLHRTSVHGPGLRFLRTDVALLAIYGFAGMLVCKQKPSTWITGAAVGAQFGLVVGSVAIVNHLIEALVPDKPFVLIISPVLLTLALLGMAGAVAWQRTGSLALGVMAGAYCAVAATLITLCFAISFNLLFAARVDWQLREAFAASGMIERAGFRVRNILEAASEILVRMPLLAISLATAGAVMQAWMSRESRRVLILAAGFLAPFVFAVGAAALWHANSIERAARPPFVLSGVLLTGVVLCAAYPIWSALHSSMRRS